MPENLIHNGKLILKSKRSLTILNRAFRYGDGLFETIRISKGEIMFLESHLERLIYGMNILKMDVPKEFTIAYFKEVISNLLVENQIKSGGKVRIIVYRNSEGLYTPKSNGVSFIIEAEKIKDSTYKINPKGIEIGIFTDIDKPINILSEIKSLNCLVYTLAGIYAKENGFNDCLLVNRKNHLVEGISSNLFIIKSNTVYTPPIKSGCVNGIMRNKIIEVIKKSGYKLVEVELTEPDLYHASEVFLTNAVSGIICVEKYKTFRYTNKVCERLVGLLGKLHY